MRKLNIGFLMQSGLDIYRNHGPKVHFESVIKEFIKLEHECRLITLLPGRDVVEYNPETRAFASKSLGVSGKKWFVLIEGGLRKVQTVFKLPYLGIFDSFRYFEACNRHLGQCDLFYERYSLMSFGGAMSAKRLNKPFILEVHADILNYEIPLHGEKLSKFQHFVAEWISKFCFRQTCKIVVVSKEVKRRLQDYWKIPENKIEVVPLGVDVELFEQKLRETNFTGVENKKGSPKIKTVFFMGSFLLWHGVDVLVDSFSYVVDRYPMVRLKLVGDGLIKPLIEEKVNLLGLENQVEFSGDVSHDNIPDLLLDADICVAPYKILSVEMWFSPLKVFEYMYMGKPIVASNSGQISEILQHEYSAYLVEPDNPEALANAILKLLLNPEIAKELGKNAKKRVLNGYTWQDHCKQIEQIMLNYC